MRVLVVESDPAVAQALVARLPAAEGFHVLGPVGTLSAAYHQAEHRRPAVVALSGEFAMAPELEVMKMLFEALGIGAVLLARSATEATRLAGRADQLGWGLVAADGPLPAQLLSRAKAARQVQAPIPSALGSFDPERVVLIGSSTGGVDALAQVLKDFPANCPPTVIVQHTGAGFSEGLVRLLDRQTAPRVMEARHRMAIAPGQIVVAPGVAEHLQFSAGQRGLVLRPGAPVSGHRPSVDQLFTSAVPIARHVTAAILTGMGRDGAEGLLELRRAGAVTIAQDKDSSVVYGMPRVAAEIGAAESILPLSKIGRAILASCRRCAA